MGVLLFGAQSLIAAEQNVSSPEKDLSLTD
jgi:hypothetical protein